MDELDARFHSLLLEMLIASFHNPEINPINSQLIFTTHNTHLLDQKLRRDQMVIVDKNEWGNRQSPGLILLKSLCELENLWRKNIGREILAGFQKSKREAWAYAF
ncbi:hypothetical protein [Paraflavitalea speifideaquila]|uniref:AAA family ATPase n=1 Tax=Paraflavitalea speifideaquila TaxID=3076558 RepID=UPI0028E7A1AE|nr:hypothetical protein [Paraflavitalea speifideiaquila]